jgi:hypothetical protein
MKSHPPLRPRAGIRPGILAALLAASLAGLPAGCLLDKTGDAPGPGPGEGPSTETGNPNLRGILRDAQGRPTAGFVKLYLLPAAAHPDSAALKPPRLLLSHPAAEDGRYRFDSLPPGVYALEAADLGERAFSLAPGLALAAPKDTLIRDLFLFPPARLTGAVTRGPNPLPAGVADNGGILVRLGGADRSAVTDSLGRYDLGHVPEGVYRVAFAAPDGHYEPAFLDTVRAASGVSRELPLVELQWSRFQDPPPPAGLRVVPDSATGVVRLTWRPVKLANLAFYEVARIDSLDTADNAIFRTADTAFADTVRALPASRTLTYRIAAVNALGNRSPPGPLQTRPAVVPAKPDTGGSATLFLAGVALGASAPMAGVRVLLYTVPAAPGSPDSPPLTVRLLDSALSGMDGRYLFRKLGGPGTRPDPEMPGAEGPFPAARYAVLASTAAGTAAMRSDLPARADSLALDTLILLPTGTVEGLASRDSQWISNPGKTDMNIPVSLAGTPFKGVTELLSTNAGARFSLNNIPAGKYRLVVYTPPDGYFLPDTLEVTVAPGSVAALPGVINARYNPSAPPPRIASLVIASSTRASVRLSWKAMDKYDPLQGYRVLRLDANRVESARSGVIADTAWTDDVSALPRGSAWYYVARVVDKAGRESGNGGDRNAQPIPFTVP